MEEIMSLRRIERTNSKIIWVIALIAAIAAFLLLSP